VKSKRLRYVGKMASVWEMKKIRRILVEESLERPKRRWWENIKLELKEQSCKD
jgi:hypothetical protein